MRGKGQWWFIYLCVWSVGRLSPPSSPSPAHEGADLRRDKYPATHAGHEPVMEGRKTDHMCGLLVFKHTGSAALQRTADPHPRPSVSIFSSSRTVSPLEPDVPDIQRFWQPARWESRHSINENIREEEKRKAEAAVVRFTVSGAALKCDDCCSVEAAEPMRGKLEAVSTGCAFGFDP